MTRFRAVLSQREAADPVSGLARAISVVCCPPALAAPAALLAGLRAEALPARWTGIVTLLAATAVFPSAFICVARVVGLVQGLDLRRRSERLLPSVFAVVSSAAAYPLLRTLDAPEVLRAPGAAVGVQVAVLSLITLRWKISCHTAAARGLLAVTWTGDVAFLTGPVVGLVLLVVCARVHPGASHTVANDRRVADRCGDRGTDLARVNAGYAG